MDSSGQDDNLQIGKRLRERRQKRNLTLDQLALDAGLTKGFLSDVERDKAAPSMRSLLRICRSLQISIGSLLQSSSSNLVRASERKRIFFGDPGIDDYQLTPSKQNRLMALLTEIAPGARAGEKP